MATKKVHVLSVQSESCDHYGPFVFAVRPNVAQLKTFLRKNTSPCDADFSADGPGWKGSYLHLTWSSTEVNE